MKKLLMWVPALLLLAACHDNTPLETVRSLPVKGALSKALDSRPACEKTTWQLTAVMGGLVE